MRVEDACLANLTTFRMGGPARLYYPETPEDLAALPHDREGRYRVLSNGSNVLANDKGRFEVVCMRDYDRSVVFKGDGRFRVGASCPVQSFIRQANKHGYGDMEELVCIPGLLGGLIAMNASVPSAGVCVSDHIVSVRVYTDGEVRDVPKEECAFGHRRSRFLDGRDIVLSAEFVLPKQDPAVSQGRIAARKKRVALTQDRSAPNFGSVFSQCSEKIMKLMRGCSMSSGGCRFSAKTTNWMLNNDGSFDDAMKLIRCVERLHKMARKPCSIEVQVWR